MEYIDSATILNEDLISLELEISTVDAHNSNSGDLHYVNMYFPMVHEFMSLLI